MSILAQLPPRLQPFALNQATGGDTDLTDRVNDLRNRYERHLQKKITGGDFESRYFKALTFVVPFLASHLPKRRATALEIGCGKGAKSFPLSLMFDDYYGFDIVRKEIDFAREIQKSLGTSNTHFLVDQAANLETFLQAANVKFDAIILYAILEHLTVDEKIGLLALCWRYLENGGVLLIGEVPNRMFPIDYHSTKSLYFQQMPLPLWPKYLHRVPNQNWKDIISNAVQAGELELKAFRHGMHVGHQEFDLAFGDVESLTRHIIADNYEVEILNLYPYESIEYLKYAELLGLRQFESGVMLEPRKFPHLFSRYYLEALLKKNGGNPHADALEVRFDEYGTGTTLPEKLRNAQRLKKGDAVLLEFGASTAPPYTPISVTLGFRDPMSSGAVRVTTASSDLVYEGSVQEMVLNISKWRRNISFRLRDIMGTEFPLKVMALDDAGVSLRYSILRQT